MPIILIESLNVMLGAAIGGLLRYFCMLFLPMPVLIVNTLGSLIIGFSYYKLTNYYPQHLHLINTGLLGGLTTFSSFSLELLHMINDGFYLKAMIYSSIKLILCLACCLAGYKLALINS